ncbi:uncharacterized protein LOC118430827 isoform X2 [Branchiostoma floridae]|uniref:Uncharacterized protein LOC118430827 isoform X2 n=1 Tax=Branchiostoma floridae TaxID=7739 RepID=A0A9J7NB33_BRAFL|nr:uncharacterized protein LOC118430827 isoform X2 [Branchiostoma floridae]
MPKTKAKKKSGQAARVPRTPTVAERQAEALAVARLRHIGERMGYHQLSSRVNTVFNQFRYGGTNVQRRNRVYAGLAGLLTYGLQRAPGGTFYVFSPEILEIVRETYPSGDDVDWMLINSNNRPTKEVGADDLFEDKGKN